MTPHLKLGNLITIVSFKVNIRDAPRIRIAERLKALTRIIIKVAEAAFILISVEDISFRLL
jgi:hypothetical protein